MDAKTPFDPSEQTAQQGKFFIQFFSCIPIVAMVADHAFFIENHMAAAMNGLPRIGLGVFEIKR